VGRVLTRVRRAAGGTARRARALRDRVLLPEAAAGREQWQRVPLIESVDRHIASLGPERLSAAEISGADHAGKPWKRFESLDYPQFDLCADLDERLHGSFDVVLCEQVIEHVPDPAVAASNLRELVRPGGHVIVSTPFLIRVHELPEWGLEDYWRFTPRGLRTLLERAGLEVDGVGSWGNRSVIAGNLYHWPAYRRWHSLRNEPDLPVQVWAFARRADS
jgi:SAM-dependent methyltransferase